VHAGREDRVSIARADRPRRGPSAAPPAGPPAAPVDRPGGSVGPSVSDGQDVRRERPAGPGR